MTSREKALEAALAMAEHECRHIDGPSVAEARMMCNICDQTGVESNRKAFIDHAPDCPFAVLNAKEEGKGNG